MAVQEQEKCSFCSVQKLGFELSRSGTDLKLEIWVCFGVILSLDGFYVRVFTRLGNLGMIWDWFRNCAVWFFHFSEFG